jgi:hypothetical protein
MGLDKKLSQLMDCPLPTSNTHIVSEFKKIQLEFKRVGLVQSEPHHHLIEN